MYVVEQVQVRYTYITSNSKCARWYGSTQSKWLKCTFVKSKQKLSKSNNLQEWPINADYILGEIGVTKRVHLIQMNVNFVAMPLPTPEPQYQKKHHKKAMVP